MPKNSFDRIMDWPYHPQAITALSFSGCFTAAMQDGGPVWAAVVAAAFVAPFAALLLFLPYLAVTVVLSILLTLFQSMLKAAHPLAAS